MSAFPHKSDQQLLDDHAEMTRLEASSPSEERQKIYRATRLRIEEEMRGRGMLEATEKSPVFTVKKTVRAPKPPGPAKRSTTAARTVLAGNFSRAEQPISSSIEVLADAGAYNPQVKITCADGYSLTVDEAAARSRFGTTFRDTCTLKVVAQGRFNKMWRWDTPWRCAGFYQALTAFYDQKPPSLQELGIARPTELHKAVFLLIAEKSAVSEGAP